MQRGEPKAHGICYEALVPWQKTMIYAALSRSCSPDVCQRGDLRRHSLGA